MLVTLNSSIAPPLARPWGILACLGSGFPNSEKGEIPSITQKEFLSVKGDGKSTLKALILEKPRAVLQAKRLVKKFEARWNSVIPEGEKILLEK